MLCPECPAPPQALEHFACWLRESSPLSSYEASGEQILLLPTSQDPTVGSGGGSTLIQHGSRDPECSRMVVTTHILTVLADTVRSARARHWKGQEDC